MTGKDDNPPHMRSVATRVAAFQPEVNARSPGTRRDETTPRVRTVPTAVSPPATGRPPVCVSWGPISPEAQTHIEQAQNASVDALQATADPPGISNVLEQFVNVKGRRWWKLLEWTPLVNQTLPDTVPVGDLKLTRDEIRDVLYTTQHSILDVSPGIMSCMTQMLPESVTEWSDQQRSVVALMAVSGFVKIFAKPLKVAQKVFYVCSPARTHARSRMAVMRIWHHALTLMQRAGVTHAVLSAPQKDASLQELFLLLSTNGYGMTAVFVCTSDPVVYATSCDSLRQFWAEKMTTTCVAVMQYSLPISWAAHLDKRGMQTGMMIMTHPYFVRHRLHPVNAWNWDGPPQIPPEFLQTTLLLHHHSVTNPDAVELIPDVAPLIPGIPGIDTFVPCTGGVDKPPGDCHRGCHATSCTDYCISWGVTVLDNWQRDRLYDVLNLSGSQMDLKAQYDARVDAMKTLMGGVVQLPSATPSAQSHFPRKATSRSPRPESTAVRTYQADYETAVVVKDDTNTPPEKWSDAHQRFSSLCALSGWVTLAPTWEKKVFCVSAVGINYGHPANRVFDGYAPAIHRMRRLWHHVLTLFSEAPNVTFVALNAIGCGQFARSSNNREHIPRWCAEALCDVLETGELAGKQLTAIFVVLHDHYGVFQQVITQRHRSRKPDVTVCLTRIHSMIDIANRLPSGRLGILNSSNERFVRRGEMAWLNTEQMNVQMVLAVQTTLLFQLREVNPAWSVAMQGRRGPGAGLFNVNETVPLSGGRVTRLVSELFVVMWTWTGQNDAVLQCVSRVLGKESMTTLSMREVWKRDRWPMTRFMQKFFRIELHGSQQTSLDYTNFQPITGFMLEDNAQYKFGTDQQSPTIPANALIKTQLDMRLSYLDDQVPRLPSLQTLVQNRLGPPPALPRAPGPKLDDTDDTLCAVTGNVYLLVDPLSGTPLTNPPQMVCVSIPGINFGLKGHRKKFTETPEWRPNLAAQLRMSQIWHHTLSRFQQWGVTHPVLCAIGCGAFVPDYMSEKRVTEAYARELVNVLAHTDYGFEAVFLSLPASTHFSNFHDVIQKHGRLLRTPVVLTHKHGMLDIALALHRDGKTTGFLNPSDSKAVLDGAIGMYWLGRDIALEEVIAVQTTLLLHSKAFDSMKYWNRSTAVNDLPPSLRELYRP